MKKVKIQTNRYSTVSAYIESLPDFQKKIAIALRNLITELSPKIQESIKYTVPFYSYHGMLCYISPTKKGINLGLVQGIELSNENGILTGDHLKQIRHIAIKAPEDFKENEIRTGLMEAMLVNELKQKKK